MKKLIQATLLIVCVSSNAHADNAGDEIVARFNTAFAAAKDACAGLSDRLNSLKAFAGVGVGAGAVGTAAGGAALGTGLVKSKTDDEIQDLQTQVDNFLKNSSSVKVSLDPEKDIKTLEKFLADVNKVIGVSGQIGEKRSASQTLGNVRTGASFASGAGGAVGATMSFASLKTFDDLIIDMDACDSRIKEIDRQKTELVFAAPGDKTIAKMDEIVKSCGGLNSKNIADIKKAMTAAGIVSAVGAAAGIAGGITSAVAVNNEKAGSSGVGESKALNLAANISAGVATGANLGGAIVSGIVLAGLNKNSQIADKCKGIFSD